MAQRKSLSMKSISLSLILFLLISSCHTTSEQITPTTDVSEDGNRQSVAELDWLNSIFQCENGEGFCFPNENEVCSERYMEFLIEGNQIYGASHLTDQEKKLATVDYQKKWQGIYPLETQEIWPFGRGNGDVIILKNVSITPLGSSKYEVNVVYDADYSTKNIVRLIPVNQSYQIDYIETKYNESTHLTTETNHRFVFTQKWTWAYQNDLIEKGEWGNKGEFSVYYDEINHNWLLTKESYGDTGAMVNWVIAQPNGQFIFSYMGEFKNDTDIIETLFESTENHFQINELYKDLEVQKPFDIAGKTYVAQLYEAIYEKNTKDHATVYLVETDVNFAALYCFNLVNAETKIPYQFSRIPDRYLLLSEEATVMGENIKLQFLGVSTADKTVSF